MKKRFANTWKKSFFCMATPAAHPYLTTEQQQPPCRSKIIIAVVILIIPKKELFLLEIQLLFSTAVKACK